MILEDLKERAILYAYRGSIAHNMYVPSSDPNSIDDKDTMLIYAAPRNYYLGLREKLIRSKTFAHEEWDEECHEVRRFINLLLASNPNVLGMLWLKPHLYFKKTEMGQMLIDNRDIFSSRMAYNSFCGYAHAQLKKMTHLAFKGYMGEKRKRLVEKFGYDTKNAAHCLRLLQMGLEFISTGQLNVWREDSDKWLSVKQGNWSLEQVKSEADRMFVSLENAVVSSPLQAKPDYRTAEEICMEILSQSY